MSRSAAELLEDACRCIAELFQRRVHVCSFGFGYSDAPGSGSVCRLMESEGVGTLRHSLDSQETANLLVSFDHLNAVPLETQIVKKLSFLFLAGT